MTPPDIDDREARPPNILLITSDQQHFDTLGVSNPDIRTPALDRLCREGTRFTRAYCANPVCSPSRSSIITGQYPSTHGCWTIGVKLPEDVPTIGSHLSAAGYAVELVGKAHFQPLASSGGSESIECQPVIRDLDFWRTFHGPWYGFSHVETARNHTDESHVGQHYALWMEERGLTNWRDYFRSWPPRPDEPCRRHRWDLPQEFHYTTWTAERTIARIVAAAKRKAPFMMWASFQDPHPSYLVPEPWCDMYEPSKMRPGKLSAGEHDSGPEILAMTQEDEPDFAAYRDDLGSLGLHSHRHTRERLQQHMAIYFGMITFMDAAIGRILDALDQLGLAQNTIVVFTSDHGHYLGHHGLIDKGPFHYEDGIRVPFIVRHPGRVPAGRVSSHLQSLVDLAPTFLHAAGLDVPGDMQGVSQLGTWHGGGPSRDHVICENRMQPRSLHAITYVECAHKITVYKHSARGQLFDLDADPHETVNLWDEAGANAVKSDLLLRFVKATMAREPTRMPRIAGA